MRLGPVLALGLFGFLGAATAKADTMQPVQGQGGGVSGSGVLTASDNGDGSYTIVSLSGTGVFGLLGYHVFNGNDNLLFPSRSTVLDGSGFSFEDSDGDTPYDVNLYATGSGTYAAHVLDLDPDGQATNPDPAVTFQLGSPTTANPALHRALLQMADAAPNTVSFAFSFAPATDPTAVTPEPGSFALLGTGFLALAGLVQRRRV